MELPPRARRIRNNPPRGNIPLGTTSACAENTPRGNCENSHRRNYLRVRGEYENLTTFYSPTRELPPRARRIRGSPYIGSLYGGTTSACAENTFSGPLPDRAARNYLRVRGEYTFIDGESGEELELPPRARRILQKSVETGAHGGTTSACAENTVPTICATWGSRNYLRVRGEYPTAYADTNACSELPPRARRILPSAAAYTLSPGTTSACAENTLNSRPCSLLGGNYLRVRGEYLGVPAGKSR